MISSVQMISAVSILQERMATVAVALQASRTLPTIKCVVVLCLAIWGRVVAIQVYNAGLGNSCCGPLPYDSTGDFYCLESPDNMYDLKEKS